MGVRLEADEAWERLASAHTGILTTLRRDGRPVPLPIWFVVLDRRIYLSTPEASRKVGRVRRDARASLLVESGTSWVELFGVLVQGSATVVTDAAERTAAAEALARKYTDHARPDDRLPSAVRRFYSGERVVIRLDPDVEPVSWDNTRIRLLPEPTPTEEGPA
jgi:PPOX class probable F420-dependent enzyme